MSEVLVVGSLAYDSIETPFGKVARTLGGSANYFSLGASLTANVRVVGVIGQDYDDAHLNLLRGRNVDVEGIKRENGATFHWAGSYEGAMNEAQTLATELNVFASFLPNLPQHYRTSNIVFLANIDPELQLNVLEQVRCPQVVGLDTMNFWITSKRDTLLKALGKTEVLFINETEAKLLTDCKNLICALEKISLMGPKFIVVKRGEYGFILFSKERSFSLPAFPMSDVVDPTGAGDSFAGGFFGYLALQERPLDWSVLKQACVHGCVMASFTIQDFGLKRLTNLTLSEFNQRIQMYKDYVSI